MEERFKYEGRTLQKQKELDLSALIFCFKSKIIFQIFICSFGMLVILFFNVATTIPQHPLLVDELKIKVSTAKSATPILQENGRDQLEDETTPIPMLKTTEEAVKTTEEAVKTAEEAVLRSTEVAVVLKTTKEAVASIKTTAADLFRASFRPQRQRPVNRFVYHHFLSGL